jgi:hypothetical protein
MTKREVVKAQLELFETLDDDQKKLLDTIIAGLIENIVGETISSTTDAVIKAIKEKALTVEGLEVK